MLLFRKILLRKYLILVFMLLMIFGGTDSQLIKALGTLLMPALDLFTSKVPGNRPNPGFVNRPNPVVGSNNLNNFDPNNNNGFGRRDTICRNTVEGHTICGFGTQGHHFDDGTLEPLATGFDEILPSNCGRNLKDGMGKLCFPDGILCQRRKYSFLF
jgi:hypothetical protein